MDCYHGHGIEQNADNAVELSWIDFTLIGVVGLSAGISLLRGFIREAMALVGWVAAVWIALTFPAPVAALFAEQVSVPSVRMGIAFGVLFVGTLVVSAVAVYLVGLLVDKTGLSGTDRLLGVVFGAARGVIIAAILVMLAGLTPIPRDPWWQQSTLLPHFQRVAEQLQTLLPPDIAKYVNFADPTTTPRRTLPPAVLKPKASG
ncbi:MAG: membrane protein required for colicin V production [Gammaproteobacteria bacterium]|jgi:membrane protein required for colicin V production